MNDLISRQAIHGIVIARYPDSDATQYNIGYGDAINDVLKDIRYMPPAEPVIRCKDCKHYRTFEDCISVSWCDLGHSREIDIYDEWFCGDAKPKEGEEEDE